MAEYWEVETCLRLKIVLDNLKDNIDQLETTLKEIPPTDIIPVMNLTGMLFQHRISLSILKEIIKVRCGEM